jgi:regulator of protease activity HflC (stomatin/prohibitin superfamily)
VYGGFMFGGSLVLFVIAGFIILSSVKVLNEYDRAVIFRLGRSIGVKGPGLILLFPIIDRMIRVGIRTVTMDVQPQDAITKDNVSIKVNAVVYFRVIDSEKAVVEVEDFYFATSQLAQTTLRSVLGQVPLDELLTNREIINHKLQDILDRQTEPWGIKVSMVEVKNIDLPKEMQQAMAREAQAERERRAKVISAEGEVQRSARLAEASNVLASSPSALQLAYLQTLTEIAGGDKTKTIVFPLPLDMFQVFLEKSKN